MGIAHHVCLFRGFPGGSDGNEAVCNAGDPGSIRGPGRSLEKGIQPTPVFLPGEFHGQRSLAGYSPRGRKESDTTERPSKLSLCPAHRHSASPAELTRIIWAFPAVLVVKDLPANAGDIRDVGLIPGSGRSPGGRNSLPLQHSCLWTEEPGGL